MHERPELGVDITNCDREPIHIPGAIQPHGVLLALQEPEFVITHASENASALFGIELSQLLGRPLLSVIPGLASKIQSEATREHIAEVNPLRIVIADLTYDAILHRHQGSLILEIESRVGAVTPERRHHPLRRVVSKLQSADSIANLLTTAAEAVRGLTGFERVMIYSFDDDGHGSVDAEAKSEALDAYLGLHYPASDIPRQARELYLRSLIRSIPDARYIPVPLRAASRSDTALPLDLSFAALRSVSPVHLEYLANIGIRASMSISLVVHDRLWGLISCAHHSGPHFLPYDVRSDCEIVGRMMSLLIGAFEDREIAAARLRRQPMLEVLAAEMRAGSAALPALLARPVELFALLRIEGAAIVGDEVHTAGKVPPGAAINEVATWLQQTAEPGVFATDSLSKAAPEFAAISESASGVVSFSLPGAVRRQFIGFRPEILQTVDWGGDPRKPLEPDGTARLHPRRSFALWREEVRLRSRRWTRSDREAAEDLRRVAVEVDLEKQVAREQRAVQARDDLVAVVSHDLKNPLNVIQMQSVLLRQMSGPDADERSARLRAALDRIQRSVGHMDALIHDLLDLARIEAGRFAIQCRAELLDEIVAEALIILRPLADAKGLLLRHEAPGGVRVLVDRERVFQVLSNLVGNAIKFTPAGGRIGTASVHGGRSGTAGGDR